jgi:hypothetical protein
MQNTRRMPCRSPPGMKISRRNFRGPWRRSRWGPKRRKEIVVQLIFYYVASMIAGDFAAYAIGFVVEREFGSSVSLIVFLTLYFLSLWIAWLFAVWMTEPKHVQPEGTA